MSAKITNFSGYFYIIDSTTGKLIVEKSFRSYEDAKRELKSLLS